MANNATKIALVFLVFALPAAAFARAAGTAELRERGALIGAAQQGAMLDQNENAPKLAPIPPPRIYVPAIPKFK
jgi:hypothetical protein